MRPAMNPALNHATLDQAREMLYSGRVSEKDFGHYMMLWTWGAARFGGSAAIAQDRYYRTHGPDALLRRRGRIKRIIDALRSA